MPLPCLQVEAASAAVEGQASRVRATQEMSVETEAEIAGLRTVLEAASQRRAAAQAAAQCVYIACSTLFVHMWRRVHVCCVCDNSTFDDDVLCPLNNY